MALDLSYDPNWKPDSEPDLSYDPNWKPPKQNTSLVGDIGTGLKRGVLQMPGMVTGLADLATTPISLATGVNRPLSKAADWLGEKTGFQPEKWAKNAEAEYSPEMQQAQENVEAAKGFFPTLGAVAKNPRMAANLVAESLPSTIAGGVFARGAMGAVVGAEKLAALRAAAGSTDAAVANAAKAQLLKAGAIAGGIGEGAVTAGQQMSQTGYDVNPALAAGTSLAAGIGTGIIGAGSGRLANSALGKRLGLSDIETSMAAGTMGENTGKAGLAGYAKRIGAGTIQEGLLEEAPQSYQEQVWQNLANGKPWNEGAAEAAAQGAIAGGIMGGGVNAIPRSRQDANTPPNAPQDIGAGIEPAVNPLSDPQALIEAAKLPVTGPMSDAVNKGLDSGAIHPTTTGMVSVAAIPPVQMFSDQPTSTSQLPQEATNFPLPTAEAEQSATQQAEPIQTFSNQPTSTRSLSQVATNLTLPQTIGKLNAPSNQTAETLPKQEEQQAKPAADVAPAAKEPWQMTRKEFAVSAGYDPLDLPNPPLPKNEGKKYPITRDVDVARESAVKNAIAQGKPVPAEVLAEYPDLKPTVAEFATVAQKPQQHAPTEKEWTDAITAAESQWSKFDRGQRSMLATQIGYGNAQFGPKKKSITTMEWADLPANVQRDLGKSMLGKQPAPQAEPINRLSKESRDVLTSYGGVRASIVGELDDYLTRRNAPLAENTKGEITVKTISDEGRNGFGLGYFVREHSSYPGMPVISGRWMDFWEPYMKTKYGVSKSDYEKLGVAERAEIENKNQAEKWADVGFYDSFAEIYLAKEWQDWWDSLHLGKHNRGPAENKKWKSIVESRFLPQAEQPAADANLPAVRQQLTVEFGGTRYPVDSIEDASRKWEKFRDETGEGVSKLGNGVPIFDQTGKQVAYVSYNGTVWNGSKYDKNATPLYEPKSEPTPATLEADSKASAPKADEGKVATAQGGAASAIKAYPKAQATMLAASMTKKGLPSEAYPHPTEEGKFAIRAAGTATPAAPVERKVTTEDAIGQGDLLGAKPAAENPQSEPAPAAKTKMQLRDEKIAADAITAANTPWLMTQDDYVESRMDSARNNPDDPLYAVASNYSKANRSNEFSNSYERKFADEWFSANEKAAIEGKPVAVKPTWMTAKNEWVARTGNDAEEHLIHVKAALADGKPVPENVLADYPDLKPAPVAKQPDSKGEDVTPREAHAALFKDIYDGTATLDEYKAGFQATLDAEDAIKAELNGLTKDALFKEYPGLQYRYKNEKKADVVNAAYRSMLDDFVLGDSISYSIGEKYENVLRNYVERETAESLAAYSAKLKAKDAERETRLNEIKQGAEDPKTLDDFMSYFRVNGQNGETFGELRKKLTPEQRALYDSLASEKTRAERKEKADQQKTDIRAAAQTTEGQIVETKHTKTGEALFVVKAAERVERDVYNQWNATAKRLGGYYSSFRGTGAVPGFQFKTMGNAEAFLKFIGGDVSEAKETIQIRRDEFADDRSQSAVERLTEMADRLDERADESLSRERKANTNRRARFAASAESSARSDKALAATMRNIAKAIENGLAKLLDRVRQKSQVEMLQEFIRNAKNAELREKYPSYADQEKNKGEAPGIDTVEYAQWPSYIADRSDLANLGRQLVETEGTKKLGQQILKVADDVTAEYKKFAKENLFRVSTFNGAEGQSAVFRTEDDAERAIARSGFKGKATTISFKRGEHLVIMGPSMAREAGIWQGDDRKRITLTPAFGAELVEKVGKVARGNKNAPRIPWQFENAYDKRKRLAAMGIETPAEFRSALREFISLREQAKEPDRIKELERAMIGRKNDGLDFFPTPKTVAQEMIDAAEIKEGMSVLEPSAGMGHIAEQIRDVAGIDPDVVEMSNDRKELLEAKGFRVVGSDFMDVLPRGFTYGDIYRAKDGTLGVMRGSGGMGSNRVGLDPLDENGNPDMRRARWEDRDELEEVEKRNGLSGYDRIIMNPPFSDRRDAQHVQHAYTLLKPGGRIVALMGEGVFFGQDSKAKEFRAWLDSLNGTSEKLEEGTFLDPSLPVNTSVNARLVVVDKPVSGVEKFNQANDGRITPADKAIYGMASEGKSAQDILKHIASTSRNPFYRQVAKLLLKTGINPTITVGDSKGWKFNAGDGKYAAAYNPKTDTVALFRPAASERNVVHELIHSASIKALEKNGLASMQLKALFNHVKKSGKLQGMYGMADIDEFMAEAFSNPKFQQALKKIDAPIQTSGIRTAWDWFIRAVRNILGLKQGSHDALSRALDIGLGVMRENMALKGGAKSDQVRGSAEPSKSIGKAKEIEVDGVMRSTLNSNGKPIHPTEEGVRNFYAWFGESKATDAEGRPLVLYHGSPNKFNTFLGRNRGIAQFPAEIGASFFTSDKEMARGYAGGEISPMELYLKITDPEEHDAKGGWWISHNFKAIKQARENGNDGVIIKNVIDTSAGQQERPIDTYITFDPTQIKSATSNTGAFSDNPDIRYNIVGDARNWVKAQASPGVQQAVANAFKSDSSTSWVTSFNTQYHKAEKWDAEGKPWFKRVFNLGQKFLSDTSRFAIMAQNAAPKLFHEWKSLSDVKDSLKNAKSFRDITGKTHNANIAAIAAPLYEGTLYGGGNPMSGVRFNDAVLRKTYKLTDEQIKLYNEALDAVNVSMDEMAKSIIAKHAKNNKVGFDSDMGIDDMAADVIQNLEDQQQELEEEIGASAEESYNAALSDLIEMDQQDEAAKLKRDFARTKNDNAKAIDRIDKTIKDINGVVEKNQNLQDHGYFPLMRFGDNTVTATDENGETQFFGMYEGIPMIPRSGQYEANQVAQAIREEHPEWTVTTGINNTEKYKLYRGLNLEAVQLFAEHMDAESLEPFQEYLRQATNDRSVMKRLIHRKGTPGFSKDVRRTLAQFIVSNARHTSSSYNLFDMRKAAESVPNQFGDIGKEAVKLHQYVSEPLEEAQKLRGFLFFNYLGGSIASAMVNMTQVPMMTFPFLSQYDGVVSLGKRLAAAAKLAAGNPDKVQGKLGEALRRAELDGVTAPQNMFELTATAANSIFSGSRGANFLLQGWGKMFSMAEVFNRRTTFIAAFNIADQMSKEQLAKTGFKTAFDFAENAVKETQGIYNKGNRPNVGRGAVGATLMTFKQYSIMYLELLKRLPRKQQLMMLGLLVLAAGVGGLPFAEDIEDIIDTFGQWLGYATNTKRSIRNAVAGAVGTKVADILLNGALSQMGIDLHGRMGMNNLIPASGILKKSSVDKGRDVEEFFGPAGSLVASLGTALENMATGHFDRAAMAMAPVAVQNAVKGSNMADTGFAEDMKGRRTVPVNQLEAGAKAIGFNPKSVANFGTIKRDLAQDQRLLQVKREEITSGLASAILSGDQDARKEVFDELKQWNTDNPNMRLTIDFNAVSQRVRQARAEGVTRFMKTLPKGMRASAREEFAQ